MSAPSTAPKAVSIAEAARLLGVCRDTVYSLLDSKKLKSVKAGKRRLIPIVEIDRFLAAR